MIGLKTYDVAEQGMDRHIIQLWKIWNSLRHSASSFEEDLCSKLCHVQKLMSFR